MPTALSAVACTDCSYSTTELLKVRQKHLCHACFSRYVSNKVWKRTEPYRPRNPLSDQRPKVLLPLSGGVSSLALLHCLDLHTKERSKTRKNKPYDIVLVHINLTGQHERVSDWREAVQGIFSDHEFIPIVELQDVLRHDALIEEDLRHLGLVRNDGESDTMLLSRLFQCTKTATARSELEDLFFQRLVIATAKGHNCDGIAWGHSTDRLAARALADVARGRGGSLPGVTSGSQSQFQVGFTFPVGELHKKELQSYTQIHRDTLVGCILEQEHDAMPSISIRDTSIGALLTDYITSQGEKYPSIVSNVVRTVDKLQVPITTDRRPCKVCHTLLHDSIHNIDLCYGCIRLRQDIKI